MRILGIESTAHTFGVGIYDSSADKILANEKAYYKPINEGIVPRKAADFHSQNGAKIIEKALARAKTKITEIDAIAYSAGPGLGPCLQVGACAAAFLAAKYDLPLVPINHCHAHIEIGRWQCKFSNPLVLYVSGGNTQIIIGSKLGGRVRKSLKLGRGAPPPRFGFGAPFAVLGETLDIGIGNLFDVFARELKIPFAHGSVVAQKAMKGKNYHPLPYTIKGMNFVFSGLLTCASKMIGKINEEDLCYSLMETAFCELAEGTERALMLTRKKEILVCGGVAQNHVLVGKIRQMAKLHGANAGTCENEYNADNGAMIALTGAKMLKKGKMIKPQKVWIDQKYRIDMVK